MSTQYQIGEYSITLSPPQSMAIRWEIYMLSAQNPPRAFFAALAACWTGPGKPSASLSQHRFSVGAWGAAVLDELASRGVSPSQAQIIGANAYRLITESIPGEDDVIAAGNGSSEEEPSTG
tara:strand:+ start:2263 stop:2625 length:363 start_codon:yes stop_codon:yes gene_type:complete